ncbi:MAG: magnesium/cobalt transporter CorA [Saprospiraceae bacterium]|nr:magnesium/cobalt transporter CorA [Saprospiraceae bacterium]
MAKKKRKKTGLAPGSLVFTGNQYLDNPLIQAFRYDEQLLEEKEAAGNLFAPRIPEKKYWYDVRGIHDKDLIEQIGTAFGMHPLVMEDILDPEQRPKIEEYEDGIFLILQALTFNQDTCTLETEQVSIYIGTNFIWSFQEKPTDLFSAVRERMRKEDSRIRKRSSDYLAYALMDSVVDHYFLVLDEIELAIANLEAAILEDPNSQVKADVHSLKLQGVWMRKTITPLREAVGQFSRSDHPLIQSETQIYLRDLYDHVIQIMDLNETYRDVISGLYELYQSELGMKMNNIMKTLTIISTIFIPLGFLAGVYGMNFDVMPELRNPNGYMIWWAVVTTLVIGMLFIFRRQKWL